MQYYSIPQSCKHTVIALCNVEAFRPAPVQICTHSLRNRTKAESALTMLKDLGHLKHIRPVVKKNMPEFIYKVLNTCDNAVDGCIDI